MKLTTITLPAALLVLTAIVGQPTLVSANPEGLNPKQAAQLSRDLAPFPDFFQQGREKFEQEIERLRERQRSSTEPSLQIHVDPQAELDQFPQLQPSDFQDQSQPE